MPPPHREHQRAEHLKDMAWECRLLAGVTRDRDARYDLLLLAQGFERLADVSQWAPGLHERGAPARSHQPR
jgi:hypothetical protein